MLASTKMHHTNLHNHNPTVFYITDDDKTYAIPKKVAEKYIVKRKKRENLIPSEVVFAKLIKKYTKAGSLLRGLRGREDLTQAKFAKKIGVTQANLSKMENGKRPIGKIIAKRIEKVFGTNYRYFLE